MQAPTLAVVLLAAATASAEKPIDTRLHAGLLTVGRVASACAGNDRAIDKKALKAKLLEVLPTARHDAPITVEVPTRRGEGSCGAEFVELTLGEQRWVRVTAPIGIDDTLDTLVTGHVTALPKVLGDWAPYLHRWCVGNDGVDSRRALGMTYAQFQKLPLEARRFACHDFDPPETP